MEHLLEYRAISFAQFANNIFVPISFKNIVIKEFVSSVICEINKIISFIYAFIYEIVKKENYYVSKIYEFIFDFDSFSFNDFIYFWKIIMISLVVYFGIYLYETFVKWSVTIREMNIAIKQIRIENDLLRSEMNNYYNKNNIIADEIDTIHTELVKCTKKIKKVENQIKKLDYY